MLTLVVAASFLVALSGCGKDDQSAVSKAAKKAGERSFQSLHQEPNPVPAKPSQGRWVELKLPSDPSTPTTRPEPPEKAKAYLVRPKGGATPRGGVIMIHEWWGLNDHIQLQAEKLSQAGQFAVLAIDLYEGKVAEKREDAAKYMQAVNEKKAQRTLRSAIQYLTDGNEFAFTKLGVVGWCFGGGWSLQTALLGGESIGACVIYYGWPETSAERLKLLQCPVLGIFGKQDQGISTELVGRFEAAMKSAKKKLELHWYDAPHAFANPSNPSYNKEAAEDAWLRVLAFFKANVKG